MAHCLDAFFLRSVQRWDRLRLLRRRARFPGLAIDPQASSNLAAARFVMEPGAELCIGPGVVTERVAGALRFVLEAGARVEIGAGTWLCTDLAPVCIRAFAGARIVIGAGSFLNGCHVSAKREVALGRRCFVGPQVRIFDADQHDLDAERSERIAPVRIGDYVWLASSALVLRGVTIGDHSIVGAMSLVTRDLPPHSLAYGQPAQPRGAVGDRSQAR